MNYGEEMTASEAFVAIKLKHDSQHPQSSTNSIRGIACRLLTMRRFSCPACNRRMRPMGGDNRYDYWKCTNCNTKVTGAAQYYAIYNTTRVARVIPANIDWTRADKEREIKKQLS